jgi:hypothetical protein
MMDNSPPWIRVNLNSLRTPHFANGRTIVRARTIREVLTALCDVDPELARRVLAPDGRVRVSIIFCVGSEVQQNLDIRLQEDTELEIVAAIAGG